CSMHSNPPSHPPSSTSLAPNFSHFLFNDTATTEIYTLSLHDALPISRPRPEPGAARRRCSSGCSASCWPARSGGGCASRRGRPRSEEHTSELQSRGHLVCRLLLEKKKKKRKSDMYLYNEE